MRLKLIIFFSFILISNSYSQITIPEDLVFFYEDSYGSYFYSPAELYRNGNFVSFVIYRQAGDSFVDKGTVTIDCKNDIIKFSSLGFFKNNKYKTSLRFQGNNKISYEIDERSVEDRLYIMFLKFKFCDSEY